MQLINTEIIREPLNWLTVGLMCGFALILIHLIFPEASSQT